MDQDGKLPPGWYPDERYPGDERWWDGERWGSSRPGGYAAQVEHPILADNKNHRAVMALASLVSLVVAAVVLVVATHGGSAPLAVANTQDTPASTEYAFIQMHNGQPVRHDPCQPLHVQWNTSLAPAELPVLQQALDEFAKATGLTLVDDGETSVIPGGSNDTVVNGSEVPNTLTIAIAQRTGPSASRFLAQSDREAIGVGGFTPGSAGQIAASYVVVDAAALSTLTRADRLQLYLHELGHADGLAHVTDPNQVMYPRLHEPALTQYGSGDLAGLAILGNRSKCSKG